MPGGKRARPIASTQFGAIEAMAPLRPADQSLDQALPFGRGDAGAVPLDRGEAGDAWLRHRRRRLQGQRSRAAAAAWIRVALAALGGRAQVPRRTGDDDRRGDRDQRRTHGRLDADRQAQARDRRRRRRLQRHPAQRGRDRAQGRARRRHGRGAARGRRHPADPRGRARQAAARFEALCLPRDLPGLRLGGLARDRREDGRKGRRAPLHRDAHLSGAGGRGPEAFRVAQRLRHRGAWAKS